MLCLWCRHPFLFIVGLFQKFRGEAPKDFYADINQQIVSAADKYSALLEQRVYKEPMTKQQAIAIMYKDVKEGNLHPFVFKALADYASGVTQLREVLV